MGRAPAGATSVGGITAGPDWRGRAAYPHPPRCFAGLEIARPAVVDGRRRHGGVLGAASRAAALLFQALSAIVRGLQPSANTTRLLPSVALDVMWRTFGAGAIWMRQRQEVTTPPLGQASAITLFALAAVLTVWAWRRRLRSLAWFLTVADVSVVAVYLTARSAPNTFDPQSYRYLWAAGPFLWAAVLAGVLAWARPRLPVLRAGTKRVEEVLLVGLFVLAVVGAVTSDPLGRRANADEVRTTREVAALTRPLLPALRRDRTYGMARAGSLALLSVGPGLYRNLEQHGRRLHMVDNDVDAYGAGRSSRRGLAGTLMVVSGDRATSPPIAPPVPAALSVHGRSRVAAQLGHQRPGATGQLLTGRLAAGLAELVDGGPQALVLAGGLRRPTGRPGPACGRLTRRPRG